MFAKPKIVIQVLTCTLLNMTVKFAVDKVIFCLSLS